MHASFRGPCACTILAFMCVEINSDCYREEQFTLYSVLKAVSALRSCIDMALPSLSTSLNCHTAALDIYVATNAFTAFTLVVSYSFLLIRELIILLNCFTSVLL